MFKRIYEKEFWTKLFFPFLGIGSLIWFLIRVIPKPSRAGYPCMRVAAPLASSFIVYLLGIAGSIAAFKYAKISFKDSRYISGIIAVMVFVTFGLWFAFNSAEPVQASKAAMLEELPANVAIGQARGIFPGRVVWTWNPDATNENCDGTFNGNDVIDTLDNIYYVPSNNNEAIIKDMLSETLLSLTGASSIATAWDSIFTYFNRTVKGENRGYQAGDKIFIKTNNQGVGLTFNMNADLAQREGTVWGSYPPDMAATSPYTILATLDQLVNGAGIPQDVIYVGDPHLNINKVYYDILNADFPDVHYMGVNGNFWEQMKDCEAYGRTLSVPTANDVIHYSDRDIASTGTDVHDKIYQQMYDARYMINIAALKGHIRGGITLLAKSHFGSHTESGAEHLHRGLVSPGDGAAENHGYGKYRVLVDLLGHEHLGGKTVVNILDALWGGSNHELYKPRKWNMAPFNGDYTSSIFASIDPIALESVAHDFLRTEYNITDWGAEAYPNIEGTDDHLQQAADPTKWPDDFTYDPEDDDIPLTSLGTHEHWNNATDMQYTRNLETGDGIELVKSHEASAIVNKETIPQIFHLGQNYPNPFNPNTTIPFYLNQPAQVDLTIYNTLGQKIETLIQEYSSAGEHEITWNAANLTSGIYIYRLTIKMQSSVIHFEKRMILIK
ncbi:MAG: DUF362 domain-containing protein [Calditrichaceae bacterium]|nr:DUF362 domain-containing protein [Calditrichaceae bacterium]